MARPFSGLPQTKPAVLRIAPKDLSTVRELAAGVDASVSEVLRVLVIGGLGITAAYGIKYLIDAERDLHAAALEAARKQMAAGEPVEPARSTESGERPSRPEIEPGSTERPKPRGPAVVRQAAKVKKGDPALTKEKAARVAGPHVEQRRTAAPANRGTRRINIEPRTVHNTVRGS